MLIVAAVIAGVVLVAGIAVTIALVQAPPAVVADADPEDTVVHLLQRSEDGDDVIFRTDLTGEEAVPVFTHPHIEDFRATASHLAVSVLTEAEESALIVTGLEGQDPRNPALPGEGYIAQLQSAGEGDLVGYTFSDADLDESGGQESLLFTTQLTDAAAGAPTPIAVEGADPRVAEWRFVPGDDSILVLSFDESLILRDAGGDETALGEAVTIDGIARRSSEAVIEREGAMRVIDLDDGGESALVEPDQDLGVLAAVTPLPDGSTVRTSALLDASGLPTEGTTVSLVSAKGATRVLFEAPTADAVLQTCVSPGSRYLAVLVAPDAITNPYDTYRMPLPERLETRVIEIADGAEVVALAGSSISWCQDPPA